MTMEDLQIKQIDKKAAKMLAATVAGYKLLVKCIFVGSAMFANAQLTYLWSKWAFPRLYTSLALHSSTRGRVFHSCSFSFRLRNRMVFLLLLAYQTSSIF